MKPEKMASVIMARHKKDGSTEVMHEEGGHHPGLMSAAEDLVRAIHSKDHKGVADAMKAAHAVMASEPEEPEGDI